MLDKIFKVVADMRLSRLVDSRGFKEAKWLWSPFQRLFPAVGSSRSALINQDKMFSTRDNYEHEDDIADKYVDSL